MILNNKTKRIIVYIVGLFILALGLTLNTKANLGVSPIISVPYSISQITGLNFGDLTFIEYVVFVFIQIWIHISEKNKKRILSDLLQLPLSLVFTRFLNIFSACIPTSSNFLVQLLILALAIICTGIGAGDSMVAGFLAGYLETSDYSKAFINGLCCGSASAFQVGLATKEDVENIKKINYEN